MPTISRIAWIPPLLTLAACATAAPPPAVTSNVPASISGQSAYGLFLAGQSAINTGEGTAAAGYFARAAGEADSSDAPFVQTHAFTAALLAGDIKGAAAIAPVADDDVVLKRLAILTVAVDELASGKAARARTLLGQVGEPYAGAALLLAPFAAAKAGDSEGAIALPVIPNDPVAGYFASLDQGILYEHLRRYEDAETAFRALIVRGDPGGLGSLSLGGFLERRGRWADAAATYDQGLARVPGDPELIAAKARAEGRHGAPAMESLDASAAEALTAMASTLVVRKQNEAALAYLRLALRLDPDRDAAWLLVGDILTELGDKDAARTAYLAPKPGQPDYVAARDKLAWSLQADERKDEALEVARAAVTAEPASRDASTNLADLLRADERYPESITILDKLISGQGDAPDWRLLYMRAVDYQASDRWPEAEQDLNLALKQRPDEPELLNFLGYSWIDRGERLKEALAMVQKAVDSDPKSGAMTDSLGWGYYRLGDYKTAVDKLELAVSLEAGDPDINNHLGDAYWRVGRRIEARFQWNRVLTLEPDAKLRAEVEAKLRNGLGPIAGS
jgi:tetratricopeptide (TPR) repeat protein